MMSSRPKAEGVLLVEPLDDDGVQSIDRRVADGGERVERRVREVGGALRPLMHHLVPIQMDIPPSEARAPPSGRSCEVG